MLRQAFSMPFSINWGRLTATSRLMRQAHQQLALLLSIAFWAFIN